MATKVIIPTEKVLKVKLPFVALEHYIGRLKEVVSAKNSKDDQNLIFKLFRTELGLRADLLAVSGYTVCRIATDFEVVASEDYLEAMQEGYEGDLKVPDFVQLRTKEITNALAGFKSLFITVPTDIEFHLHPVTPTLSVHEQSLDFDSMEDDEEDDIYRNVSTFKLVTTPIPPSVVAEAVKGEFKGTGVEVSVPALMTVIDMLLPQIVDEKTIGTNVIVFEEGHMYTRPVSHVTVLTNELKTVYGDLFVGYKLDSNTLNLLKAVLKGKDTVLMTKDTSMNHRDATVLEFEAEDMFLRVMVQSTNKPFNLAPYMEQVEGSLRFTVNKLYLSDILRRAGWGKPITVEYVNEQEGPKLTIHTDGFTHSIPVLDWETNGSVTFNNRSDFLGNMALAYLVAPDFLEKMPSDVNFEITLKDKGKADILVYDDTGIWRSKVMNVKAV